jgi:hypothetical protein
MQLKASYGGVYDGDEGVLAIGHNAGFFSNCTVALWNLAEVRRAAGVWPRKLSFANAFSSYRDAAQVEGKDDLYPLYFEAGDEAAFRRLPGSLAKVNHHGFYRLIDHSGLKAVMDAYFQPSEKALAIQRQLVSKYGIDLQRTIAVIYRGTDKVIEVDIASPRAYLAVAERLLSQHPGYRVWIQTDEASVRDLFLAHFGDKCFALDEMPVSGGSVAVHDMADDALRMSRADFGVLLVAVTNLLSQTALLVNHTGNLGLWACLWRGHSKGLVQFDRSGRVVEFASPGFWFAQAVHLLTRVRRKLGVAASGQNPGQGRS